MKKITSALLLCLLAIFAAPKGASAQGPQKLIPINYGGPSAGYFTLYVADELGLFKKHGLDPKFFWFNSGAPLLAALKSRSIDVITTGLATVFALDQKIPLTIIFWELDNAQGEGLAVSSDSKVKSYKDLAQARAIGAATGTCAQVNVALIARKLGIEYNSLNVVNIAPPLYTNAFKGGAIDAALGWAPHSLMLEDAGYKIINWDPDYGGVCPSVTSVRSDFLAQNPDVGYRLALVNKEVREIIAKNPQLAIDSLKKTLSLPDDLAKKFYEKHCCGKLPTFEEQLSPTSPYSLTAKDGGLTKQLFTAGEMLHATGTIRNPLSMESIHKSIDPSYIQKVVQEGKT